MNSDYSKVDINKDRVRIVSKRMEVAVPSEDGEDDVLRVDADGVHAEVVEADLIVWRTRWYIRRARRAIPRPTRASWRKYWKDLKTSI